MKKIGILVTLMLALSMTAVSATSVDVTWSGSGIIDANMENSLSKTRVWGGGNNFDGEFHGQENGYDRVEGWSEASFNNGGEYHFSQWNDFTAGAGGEGDIYVDVISDDGAGFIDVTGSNWRRGNSLKTHGYSGYGWPGTDSPVVGASGSNYNIGVSAYWDQNENGNADSSYSGSITGHDGLAGIGVWKAGSNTILDAEGNIDGNILVKGQGSASWTQNFDNVGTIEGKYNWG